MTYRKAKLNILCFFLLTLILSWIMLLIVRLRDQIFDDSFLRLTLTLLKVYSANVVIVFTSILFENNTTRSRLDKNAYLLAILLSVVWNVLLLSRIVLFTFAHNDDINALEQYLQEVSLSSSFIISGVLTYFFTKSGT